MHGKYIKLHTQTCRQVEYRGYRSNIASSQWRRQPKKKWGVRAVFCCWGAVKSYNIHAWDPPPLCIKHFSTDLCQSQEGSEQKWGGPDPPIPPRGDATASSDIACTGVRTSSQTFFEIISRVRIGLVRVGFKLPSIRQPSGEHTAGQVMGIR